MSRAVMIFLRLSYEVEDNQMKWSKEWSEWVAVMRWVRSDEKMNEASDDVKYRQKTLQIVANG